jgi:hypothetical protein
VGMLDLPIRHCLVVKKGTKMGDIKWVRSHEQVRVTDGSSPMYRIESLTAACSALLPADIPNTTHSSLPTYQALHDADTVRLPRTPRPSRPDHPYVSPCSLLTPTGTRPILNLPRPPPPPRQADHIPLHSWRRSLTHLPRFRRRERRQQRWPHAGPARSPRRWRHN